MPGGSVSTTTTVIPRRRQGEGALQRDRRDQRRQHDDQRAGRQAQLQSGVLAQVAWPARSPAACRAAGADGTNRWPRARRTTPVEPTTCSATRSPRRRWCSAIAPAARTVTSRLDALPVDALAGAEVVERIDDDHDVAVLIGPRRGDVQRAGAQRSRPVDPTQPVARLERPNAGELVAVAWPARAVTARPGRRDGQVAPTSRTPPAAAAC